MWPKTTVTKNELLQLIVCSLHWGNLPVMQSLRNHLSWDEMKWVWNEELSVTAVVIIMVLLKKDRRHKDLFQSPWLHRFSLYVGVIHAHIIKSIIFYTIVFNPGILCFFMQKQSQFCHFANNWLCSALGYLFINVLFKQRMFFRAMFVGSCIYHWFPLSVLYKTWRHFIELAFEKDQ